MLIFNAFAQKKLTNTSWEVKVIKGEAMMLDSAAMPFIKLSEGRLSGFTACNHLTGKYELSRKKISFTEVGGTKMFCGNPNGDIEQALYESLKSVVSWKIKQGKLFFYNHEKTCVMILETKK
jgi:heat shock protein HslJ